MRYESRIFKIADTLSRHEIFDEIYILGRVGHDLPLHEKMNARTTIFRLDVLFVVINKDFTIKFNALVYTGGYRSNPLAATMPKCA